MNENILISVLNYNNFTATSKCIYSILKSNYKNFEILIVDNKSLDDSFIQLKKEFKEINCIQSPFNGGYAAGHKIAVNYAIEKKFDFIWILNNDLTVRKDTLEELLNSYKRNGIALYGSISLKSENPEIINFGGGLTDNINEPLSYNDFEDFSLEKYNNSVGERKVQSIEGSSFLIPMEIIKKYGFMREDFFMYVEETDYCYRLKKRDKLKEFLFQNGVETIIHYPIPPHKQKAFKEWSTKSLPVTEKIHNEVLSLPIGAHLTEKEIETSINLVNKFK